MTIQIFDAKTGVPQQCQGEFDGGLCGQMLGDGVSRCPVCDRYVVWKRSETWASKFGKPYKFMKRINSIPKDQMGLDLLRAVGNNEHNGAPITCFAVPYDLTRWKRIAAAMSRGEVRDVLVKASKRKTKNKRGKLVQLRGYGLLAYVLNACEKQIRERPVRAKRESAFEGLGE